MLLTFEPWTGLEAKPELMFPSHTTFIDGTFLPPLDPHSNFPFMTDDEKIFKHELISIRIDELLSAPGQKH